MFNEVGLRNTDQRSAVIDFLKQAKKPVAVQELVAALQGSVNKVTIYRMLKQFVDSGLVRQLELGGRAKYYEFDPGNDDHHHLICESCGMIEEVEACHVEDVEKEVLKYTKNFKTVSRHSLEFYGLCKKCAQKTK